MEPPTHRLALVPNLIKTIDFYGESPESILDVGCGGLAPVFKKHYGEKYTGLDLESCLYPVDVHGDAQDLHMFGDNSFDIVVAWSVVEHLLCPFKGLEEMVRVAHKVVVTTTDLTRHDVDGDSTHLYSWTPKTYGQLLNRLDYPCKVRVRETPPRFIGIIWKKPI